ncbi:oxygenase MpaB family protein [Reichenbachiella versicolor]|uniref:oxygenase MpaB family protein n=1 Tax=Reichenbachiella versicolor TaxID=1821036 RepID=UPI000D6E7160|nr:oxygenase MpaB family protein [Reichenbachiella versicolor]
MKEPVFDINSITVEKLDQFRHETDPLADQTVKTIIESGFEKQINQVFMTLVSNETYDENTFSKFDSGLAETLNDYFQQSSKLPTWLDPNKVEKGERVFSLYGPQIFMILNVSSLPMCYTCAKGAQVLYETGRLMAHGGNTDPLARRLMETAQMIINVMAKGGVSAGGAGVVTTQKIRLIHASIRYFLKSGQFGTPWDVQKYGEPINQEDLAGTLMSFGPVILSGLKKLNIDLSDEEVDAYMHCWKVIGYCMGIQEELLPETFEDGFELATKILVHQAEESEAGKELTKSCILFMKNIVPGNSFDDVPAFMIDYFFEDLSKASDKDLSSIVAVGSKIDLKDKIVLSVAKFVTGLIGSLDHSEFVRKLTSLFNRALLQGIIYHFNDGKQVQFNIPPSLQKDWKIVENWENDWTSPEIFKKRLTIQKKIYTI